jgi:oxygen-independent coproporphyrinogen-3 oxidase
VKHPSAYTTRIQHGVSPAAAREVLDETALQLERVALGIRTAAGIAVSDVAKEQQPLLAHWVAEGLVEGAPLQKGLVVATQRGRLMADFLARELT